MGTGQEYRNTATFREVISSSNIFVCNRKLEIGMPGMLCLVKGSFFILPRIVAVLHRLVGGIKILMKWSACATFMFANKSIART